MKNKEINEIMMEAINEANINAENDFKDGGPFGAVIVKDGKIIARAHNTVILNNDPTAHAEINAIRIASKILNTYDLSDCILYTSAEPCPMCLSAIIWANIKDAYYVNTKIEADKIGFKDDKIYEFIKGGNSNKEVLNLIHIENDEAIKTFNKFEKIQNKIIY